MIIAITKIKDTIAYQLVFFNAAYDFLKIFGSIFPFEILHQIITPFHIERIGIIGVQTFIK